MAQSARTRVLRLVDGVPAPDPLPGPITLDTAEPVPGIKIKDGAVSIDQPDGSVEIDFNPDLSDKKDSKDFFGNLASKIESSKLSQIASDLLDGIQRDIDSRSEWMQMRRRGITLLGLKLEDPSDTSGSSSAPLEGMSKIRHPLLLEAVVRFQANARSELLPATGPVKVRNDSTLPPKPPPSMPPMDNTPGGIPPPAPPPGLGHNGGPSMAEQDDLADALEKDMNHYLTVTATEYVPDTDRMLFLVGLGGDGFKKVFNCPLRRRPCSESVDAEDLIVSNASTDLQNCSRVTHKIKMRKSTLRRMQIIGAYRDVQLGAPSPPQPTPVEQKKAEIVGQRIHVQRPEDEDYTIYECYCELDLDEFAPKKFKGEGLPLPYRVTIEKDSRKVLSVIRNWEKDDDECIAKRFFVQFPFIRGIGFYGLGFIHLLGNTTNTLTAAWREMLDAGMFANFPGFLFAKSVGRQLSNQIRIPPGAGMGIELGAQQDIRAAIMPLPYKEPGPAFTSFVTHVEEVGQRLGATAEINVGEGKQDAPVGTTLALIEQATKTLDSVHKRLHAAQAEEFGLLKERFKEDPEAFWRHNKKPTVEWKKEQFLKALDDNNLVPVADPNNPTSMHRMAKANAVQQMAMANKQLYNQQAVDSWALRTMGIDSEGLFNQTPTPPPPDPRMIAIQEKTKQVRMQTQATLQDTQQRLQLEMAKLQNSAADRDSREKIEKMKLMLEGLRLQEEQMMHANDINIEQHRHQAELMMDQAKAMAEMKTDAHKAAQEMHVDHAKNVMDVHAQRMAHEHDIGRSKEQHEHEMVKAREKHAQDMEHTREKHAQDLEHAKQLAKAKESAIKKAPKAKATK